MSDMSDLDALVQRLDAPDSNERAQALAALVETGPTATPALLAELRKRNSPHRAQVAQAMAEIGDPRAEDVYRELLDDPDPTVRGRGAQGLAIIGSAAAVKALVRTIDDLPDLLHYPATVATGALIQIGPTAAPPVVPLLIAPDPATRERALLVLRTLAAWLPATEDLTAALSRYRPDASEAQRMAIAEEIAGLVGR
jgi:HEAT repeat protein